MNARNAGKAIPLVVPAFSPAGNPTLPMCFFVVGAEIDTAPGQTGVIALVECSGVHIALLSSHQYSPSVARKSRTGQHDGARGHCSTLR